MSSQPNHSHLGAILHQKTFGKCFKFSAFIADLRYKMAKRSENNVCKRQFITHSSQEEGAHHGGSQPGKHQGQSGDKRRRGTMESSLYWGFHGKGRQGSSGLAGLNSSSRMGALGLSLLAWDLALGWFRAGEIYGACGSKISRGFRVWSLITGETQPCWPSARPTD